MTSQISRNTGWRRAATGAVAGGALAAGMMIGLGSGTANADVLDDIGAQYDTGSGGGQVSQLVHSALKLRSLGFVPSKGNMADLQAAMDQRPNEMPMITALKSTVAFQQREQARGQTPANPTVIGINQYNPSNPGSLGGLFVNPGSSGAPPGP